MTSFAWLGVVSFELTRQVYFVESRQGLQTAKHRRVNPEHLFRLSWKILSTEHAIKPGYGTDVCWLNSDNFTVLVYFIVPTCLEMIFNLVCFGFVANNLRASSIIGAVSIFNPQVIKYFRKNDEMSTKTDSQPNTEKEENISDANSDG